MSNVGIPWYQRWTTHDEITSLDDTLYNRDTENHGRRHNGSGSKTFLAMASIILSGRRHFSGEGMEVDVEVVKQHVRERLMELGQNV
jgi:hypothetical protein